MVAKKNESVDQSTDNTPAVRSQKKGRPTPTRKEAQARQLRPLVPADRKAAKREAKRIRSEEFRREQEALRTGDDRYMPYAHQGKARRFVRDMVDCRWTISEFMVPLMLLFLAMITAVAYLKPESETAGYTLTIVAVVFYSLFILSILEAIVLWRRIKKISLARYGEDPRRGGWFYMYSRMVMPRRWRTPPPQVARGDKP